MTTMTAQMTAHVERARELAAADGSMIAKLMATTFEALTLPGKPATIDDREFQARIEQIQEEARRGDAAKARADAMTDAASAVGMTRYEYATSRLFDPIDWEDVR